MIRALVVLAAALPAGLPCAAQQPAKLAPLTLDGYNKMIAAHKGKVVLADFWATYCIPCRTEIPEIVKLAAQLRPRGLDLVIISADDPQQTAVALKFIAPKAPGLPLYIKQTDDDDKYAAGIHARWDGSLPANFIYDRTGVKRGAFMGEVPTKNLQDVLEKLL